MKPKPKPFLTRNEKDMIHITALAVFAFTLIGAAIIALALGLS